MRRIAPESDHPRSRGVYDTPSQSTKAMPGSSPLARGLPVSTKATIRLRRIIPARAGFTLRLAGFVLRLWDHPRSRGVYWSVSGYTDPVDESSPLARGLLHDLVNKPLNAGIIPARAGFTLSAHLSAAFAPGSSPLARGLRDDALATLTVDRIIPARAGFTLDQMTRWLAARDHPRSRGVYFAADRMPFWLSGSSPLARGLRPRTDECSGGVRIIPARAGFTHAGQVIYKSGQDHPRSRGVYSTSFA